MKNHRPVTSEGEQNYTFRQSSLCICGFKVKNY